MPTRSECLAPSGIDLLAKAIDVDNLFFDSEMVGAVRGIDSETGLHFDDTKQYIDEANLSGDSKRQLYENAIWSSFAVKRRLHVSAQTLV